MKKYFSVILSLFFISSLYSLPLLDQENSSWYYVMPGKLVCEPQNTSYGYLTLDDSRTLTAFTSEGDRLWEHKGERGNGCYLSVLNNDFISLVSHNGQKLQLLNPSGSEIWTVFPDEALTDKAYGGRDGRFFVRNSDSVSCYGLNGIKKWTVKTPPQKKLPVFQLNDGSLAVFLEKSSSGTTTALRISPFGELYDSFSVEGELDSAEECEAGLLYSLKDGTAGLIYVQNGKIGTRWKFKIEEETKNMDFAVSTDSSEAAILCRKKNKITVLYINIQNGNVKNYFDIQDLENITFKNLNSSGLLLSDSKQCAFYNFSGVELWNGYFPESRKNEVKYTLLYNSSDYLMVFDSKWNARAYKVTQNTKQHVLKKLETKKIKYEGFLSIDADLFDNEMMTEIDSDISDKGNLTLLSQGNYGAKEKYLMGKLLSGCKAYEGILFTKNSRTSTDYNVFETDNAGLEAMIAQMALFGTDTFTDFIAYVINYETNRTNLNAALLSIKDNGYDPEGKILSALYKLAKRTGKNDSTVAFEICDGVLNICRFMGKPAFNRQGKEIISTFLYPQYNQNIKDYARETFKKISSLDL